MPTLGHSQPGSRVLASDLQLHPRPQKVMQLKVGQAAAGVLAAWGVAQQNLFCIAGHLSPQSLR